MEIRKNTSYCGLWCNDCIPSDEELFQLAKALDQKVEDIAFEDYAKYKESKVPEFKYYKEFKAFLTAMEKIHCHNKCYDGPVSVAGCASNCKIRMCAIEKELEGCWQCVDFRRCPEIAGMQQMHPDIVHNLEVIKDKGIEEWKEKRGRHYNFKNIG